MITTTGPGHKKGCNIRSHMDIRHTSMYEDTQTEKKENVNTVVRSENL